MKKILAFGFFVTSFISLAIFISAVGAAPTTHAATASPAVAQCLNTCAGTCNENASTGVVTCSTAAAASTGCPDGQVMDGFGTCATQATIDAQNTAATAAQNQSGTQTVTAQGGQGFTALAPIPGLTDAQTTSVLNGNTLALFFNNLYKYLIGLAATLAVIEIIWGGLEISTKDSVSKKSEGKERITQAIFGLILVLSPVLVFSIINPSILNLSLNLPPIKLDTPVMPGGGTGSGSTSPVVDPTTLCSVTGVVGALQIATCPSDDAANQWSASCWRKNLSCASQNSTGCTQKIVSCESMSDPVVFVDVGESGSFSYILQPINSTNASSFQQFKSNCDGSGGVLCTVGLKTAGSSSCSNYGGYTTNIPGGASGKCYNTPVMCFSQSDASSATSYIHLNPFNTSSYYSCAPDVQFNPQSIQ